MNSEEFEKKFDEFIRLLNIWESQTAYLSSFDDMCDNDSFKQIVAMGECAISFIMRSLSINPSFIFLALHRITGENPIKKEHRGQIIKIISDWQRWYKDKERVKIHKCQGCRNDIKVVLIPNEPKFISLKDYEDGKCILYHYLFEIPCPVCRCPLQFTDEFVIEIISVEKAGK